MTEYQRLLLENLAEDGCWDYSQACGAERRSLRLMEERGLVRTVNYANGPHWEMTDAGYSALEN